MVGARKHGNRTASRSGRMRGLAVLSASGLLMAALVTVTAATQAAPDPATLALGAPAGTANASLFGVAGVPHSSQVWVLGSEDTPEGRTFEARRDHGRWRRFAAPKVGIYGEVMNLAAASARLVWLVGSAQQPHSSNTRPAIWRWTGKRFALSALPKLASGDVGQMAISASSASNAWVVGSINRAGSRKPVALHWGGKRWSAVATPVGLDAVSTSGPRNAWAISDGTTLVHWDGRSWSIAGETPPDVVVNAIATSSATRAYAVGSSVSSGSRVHTVILAFNGNKWSRAVVDKGVPSSQPFSVAMHGTSAWALGSHATTSGVEVPVILHTGGGPWGTQRPPGGQAYLLNAITATSSKRVLAVGYYQPAGGVGRTFLDVYNGHGWKGAPSSF
jgi:hypothetical protein